MKKCLFMEYHHLGINTVKTRVIQIAKCCEFVSVGVEREGNDVCIVLCCVVFVAREFKHFNLKELN